MTPEESQPKRRIAAYCRVSTQAEEQHHSLVAQISYYTKLIGEDPDAVLVDIYSDKGTSGTRTRNRTNFLRLIDDCRAGKVDAIITKSVSRFGRNTVDTLVFTRELRSLGIDIYFEKENLHTCSAEGELLLTLMAAVAESEAVSMSDNIKWGKRKRYEKGIIESLAVGTMLGFQQKDGEISIVEEEVAIVRRIYDYFLAGHNYQYISERLRKDDVLTKHPGSTWANKTVSNILENEKYCGDCLFQKTFIESPLTHKPIPNQGELPQFLVEDVLPAIIPREEWLAVQELRKRHSEKGLRQSEEYPFTNMLVCPYCGKKYGSYTSATHNRELLYWYRCSSRYDHTAVEVPGMMYTPPSRLRVENPSAAMVAYCRLMQATLTDCTGIDTEIESLLEEIDVVTELTKRCIAENSQMAQNQEEYAARYNGFVERYEKAKARLEQLRTTKAAREAQAEAIGAFMFEVQELDALTEFDEKLWLTIIDTITVHADGRMTFKFQGGKTLTSY